MSRAARESEVTKLWYSPVTRAEIGRRLGRSESWVKQTARKLGLACRPRGGSLRHSSVEATERFWKRVLKSEGCWNWTGVKVRGYGKLGVNGQEILAHRFSYELAFGPITDTDLFVCHRCDNPSCVRPDHLFLGSQKDNMGDAAAKGRVHRKKRGTHCLRGHAYTEHGRIDRLGKINCRKCVNDRKRRRRAEAS